MRQWLFLLIVLWALPLTASGAPRTALDSVRVCPAGPADAGPPGFNAPDCETMSFWAADPQNREIWIEIPLTMTAEDLSGARPLGVYVSARASTELYLNGVRLGANGRPGGSAAAEIPGRIDAAFFAPRDLFRAGENTIALHASAHHGLLRLTAPMQWVSVHAYGDPTQAVLAAYWPVLPVFACFVIGVAVFGVSAWRGPARRLSAATAAMAGFAGAQLAAETLRGVTGYAYPLHDYRLIAILLCAAGFGLSLLAHVLVRFGVERRAAAGLITGSVLAMIAAAALSRGFDAMTASILSAAAAIAAAICIWRAAAGRRPGWLYAAGLGAAATLPWLTGSAFLNGWFYYLAGGLVLALVVEQSFAFARERQRRLKEERRAHALDAALARARQAAQPQKIQFVSAGRVIYAPANEITRLNAAGDYVEVCFEDGRTVLYNGPLAALEESLPETFIRVHRSHIVNADFVQSLERDPGGAGRLYLAGGTAIPVSRRIMPAVRSALADGAV